VKCDCGTTQSCYIPSQCDTDSLFFQFYRKVSKVSQCEKGWGAQGGV
jgi:hypothetical protein